MIKTCLKFFSLFLLINFFSLKLIALDDSDVFLDAVFISAIKKSDYQKVLNMIEESNSTNEKRVFLNSLDSEKMSPLAYALKNEDLKMYNILIKNGASPKKKILNGSSLLNFYVTSNKSKLIENIVDSGCNINSQDKIGRTAMMMAIQVANTKAMEGLSRMKIDLEITDYSGKTIFDYAESLRDKRIKEFIRSLLDTN